MKTIGDKAVSLFEFAAMVDADDGIALSESAYRRIDAARRIVETYAAGDEPVYGLNTGLGGNLGFRIGVEDIRAFQEQLIRGRNIGVGEPLPEPVCRAALLSRIIGLSTGGSGLSRVTIALLIEMFNRRVTPVIPARGSISAADLGLAAHIGAVVIGRGEAWFEGERLAGKAALEKAGLAPVAIEPKDGLALCNNSSPSAGHAAMTLHDLGETLRVALSVAALACHGYGVNPSIFDARINAARPAAFQQETGASFRTLFEGSSLYETRRSVQDAISFRTLAPVFGAVFGAFASVRREVEIEINGATDTPLMLLDDGLMLSSPNFHTPAIALGMDTLAIAITHLASGSAQRIIKLMNPVLSGLPKYLSPIGGASAGYVPLQKTTSGLHAEIRLSAMPASLDAMPVSDTVEDVAPLTLLAVRKLQTQLVSFKLLIAIEALVAAQAVDLREGLRLSRPSQALHDAIRAHVPKLESDRESGLDVMGVHEVLQQGEVKALVQRSLSGLDLPILPDAA